MCKTSNHRLPFQVLLRVTVPRDSTVLVTEIAPERKRKAHFYVSVFEWVGGSGGESSKSII